MLVEGVELVELDLPPMARAIMFPTISAVRALTARACPLTACARASVDEDDDGVSDGWGVPGAEGGLGEECAM